MALGAGLNVGQTLPWCFCSIELYHVLDITFLADCSNILRKLFLPSSIPVPYTLQTLSRYFFLSVQVYCRCYQLVWIGSVTLVNGFGDKSLSKLSLRPSQCSGVTGNSGALKTGTLNIITFFYSHLDDGDLFLLSW